MDALDRLKPLSLGRGIVLPNLINNMSSLNKCKWIYKNRYKIRDLIEENYGSSLYNQIIENAKLNNPRAIELSKLMLNGLPDSINLSTCPQIYIEYHNILWD